MPKRGQGGKVKRKTKSCSSRAGLQFPVRRIHRPLGKGNYAKRVGASASLKYLNWQEMLYVTIKPPEFGQDIDNWQFVMTKTYYYLVIVLKEEYC